jgi:hypothetical protein
LISDWVGLGLCRNRLDWFDYFKKSNWFDLSTGSDRFLSNQVWPYIVRGLFLWGIVNVLVLWLLLSFQNATESDIYLHYKNKMFSWNSTCKNICIKITVGQKYTPWNNISCHVAYNVTPWFLLVRPAVVVGPERSGVDRYWKNVGWNKVLIMYLLIYSS